MAVDVDVAVNVDVHVICLCLCILNIVYGMYMQTSVLCTTKQNIQVPCSPVFKIDIILYITHGTLSTRGHKLRH